MNRIITTDYEILDRPIKMMGTKPYFATCLSFDTAKGKKSAWVVSSGDGQERYSQIELPDHKSFEEAPFLIELHGVPSPNSTLSGAAYQRHVLEQQPIPPISETFNKVARSIDWFVSFDSSFASQQDMADFLACWVVATYAMPVLDTVGYPWPNGERGSGKTQCLKTLTELSFMGQTVTSSSSFASVRDEAALGAMLGFDDCENIKKMEHDKRELLLAGNVKGAGFMHKVPAAREGAWDTKRIDCFAPRAFTSIAVPDDVLASRSIIILLSKTSDVTKTRRKPSSKHDWPEDAQSIRDELWLNVARALPEWIRLKDAVNRSTEVAGRDFDIFQGPLLAAKWIDETRGENRLFPRMLAVMDAYHASKSENLLPPMEHILIQALWNQLSEKGENYVIVPTQKIAFEASSVAQRWDITDPDLVSTDVQKIGLLLKRLGFEKSSSNGKARSWRIYRKDIEQRARRSGLQLESPLGEEKEPRVPDVFSYPVSRPTRPELPW